MREPDFVSILSILERYHVDVIIVGGVCAVLQGAPVSTFDLDLVYADTEENLTALSQVLENLEAVYRGRADQLKPNVDRLVAGLHHHLMTRFGPLDLHRNVGRGRTYGDLKDHSETIDLSGGLTVRLLTLDMLIRTKEDVDREKDRTVLTVLKRVREERSR